MDEPIRILYVNGGLLDYGGVTSVMLNYYHHFDKQKIHIDFLVHGMETGARDNEVLSNGSKIYNVIPKYKNPLLFYKQVKQIIKNGNYDIIHSHADVGNGFILKIAKECGVKVRISHSHNTDYTINNKFRIFLNNIQKKFVVKYATERWACSKLAGQWLYGNKVDFKIVKNAIDYKKFLYNEIIREKLRKQYNLENDIVIGHIGRFDTQKNQIFLINVFSELVKLNSNYKLVLIGDGNDRRIIENQISQLNLNEKIILLGQQNNVNELLNMFDCFVLPSLFEGLPLVAIEAQANGLQCFLSNSITNEINISNNVTSLKLDKLCWVENLNSVFYRKAETLNDGIDSGYEIESASKQLQEEYIKLVRK